MRNEKMDVLGSCDEAELIELSEADSNGTLGGSGASVAITVGISLAFCPTTKCTSQCNAT